MTTSITNFNPIAIDANLALNYGMFSLYQTDVSYNARLAESYDFVLTIGDITIFVLTAWQRCLQIEDFDELKRYHTKLANELIHRHNKGLLALSDDYKKSIVNAEALGDSYDHANLPKVYFVGILGLSTVFEDGNEYFVDYDLSSSFFYEDCVFDLDNVGNVLQVFTIKDWQNLLTYLPSPTDFCAFLKYYSKNLVEFNEFDSAVQLAHDFVVSPEFFDRVRQVEKQLERLALSVEDNDHSKAYAERQQELSPFWQKAVERLIERQKQAGVGIDWRVIRKLILQCGYTRLKFVEFVLSYANADHQTRLEGLVRHEHSYHKLGQHFVLVIYGLDPMSELSAQNIATQYQSILTHIDENLEGQNIDDLFLLGFDLSQLDEQGDIIVSLDVFYQQSKWVRPRNIG